MWKGAVHVHGGLFSHKTAIAIEKPEENLFHMTMGMYQKEKPLNYGHRYLCQDPREAKIYYRDLNSQYGKYVLGWMA
ncbi:hypothetical protein DL93DRAFT_2091403 [Clavulina sp. PMI_390]|nr:hypothetical protein DL93DRAFT_2091403 [Clavulina sp. PMI_390]